MWVLGTGTGFMAYYDPADLIYCVTSLVALCIHYAPFFLSGE